VWNRIGRSVGQRIGTDRNSMESKQPQTVRLTEERDQFILFTKRSINNNITLMHLAQFNVRLIITPTAYHTWFNFIKITSATSGGTSRSRGVSKTSSLVVKNMNLNSLSRRHLPKSQFKYEFLIGVCACPKMLITEMLILIILCKSLFIERFVPMHPPNVSYYS
jgi:hypothetical protein